jgi:beta-carotene ketolase (CrtW type)
MWNPIVRKSPSVLSPKTQTRLYYQPRLGLPIGLTILAAWSASLVLNLLYPFSWTEATTFLRILVQAHLYTGLFITAHDAMHGTVHPRKSINHAVGRIAALLFIFNPYDKLRRKHYQHHAHPVTQDDPDYHEGSLPRWYLSFLLEYVSWKQILAAAVTYNLLKLAVSADALVAFWIVPSFLSTLQLFYFGTYLPHKPKPPHANRHQSRSQALNHVLSFLKCYHFGYHYEHHDRPELPWWILPKQKEAVERGGPAPKAAPQRTFIGYSKDIS